MSDRRFDPTFGIKWMYNSLAGLLKEYNLCIFIVNQSVILSGFNKLHALKGTAMQIEKALVNDPLPVSKLSWKLCIQLFIILQ